MDPDRSEEAVRDLVRRCVAGDESAWAALARGFSRAAAAKACQVYKRKAGRNPTQGELEELTQEVFVLLARNRAKALAEFRWRSSLATYISAIAARAAMLRLRRDAAARARMERPLDAAFLADLAPSAPADDPAARAASAEEADGLRRALARLAPRERLVIGLYYWEGLSPARIAGILDTTPDYVHVLVGRIRERLRALLKEADPGPRNS